MRADSKTVFKSQNLILDTATGMITSLDPLTFNLTVSLSGTHKDSYVNFDSVA